MKKVTVRIKWSFHICATEHLHYFQMIQNRFLKPLHDIRKGVLVYAKLKLSI